MIGCVDVLRDKIAIVENSSKEEFVAIATSPKVEDFGIHRSAGLRGQLLIASSQGLGMGQLPV